MKKLCFSMIVFVLSLMLAGIASAAEGEGLYMAFDARAIYQVSVMNFSPFDIHLYNRNSSNISSRSVYSPGRPLELKSCKKAIDFCFVIDACGTNAFRPVFKCGKDGDPSSTEFYLTMDIEGRPENRGATDFENAFKMMKIMVELAKIVIKPEDIGSYFKIIEQCKSLMDGNKENGYRSVPNAVHLITNSAMGCIRLDKQKAGLLPSDVATYFIINNNIKKEDCLVIQSTAYRTNGKDDKNVKIAEGSWGKLEGEYKRAGRIAISIMSYKQFTKTAEYAMKTGQISNRGEWKTWLNEIEQKIKLKGDKSI